MKVVQLLGGLFFSLALAAQSLPQGISYQAVALDPNGHPVIGVDPTGQPIENAEINVRIAVLDGTPNGPVLYEEQHTVLTDQYGLFTLTIGEGLVASGAFNTIDWASDKKYLQTKLDLQRTGNFILAGVQQLMSVPYAFVAQSAIDKDDADSDPSNELQTLSRSNDTLYLTNGGFVVLPADQVNDGDANPTNELQNITINNRDVTLSQNGGTFTIPVDPDSDSTNELQSLSINGQIISLSKGGNSVALPPDQVDDADADPTNEIQFLMRSNDTVYLSGGGYVVLPEDQVDDADNDPVNELQSLSLNNRILSLSQNGGSFSLPVDFDSDSTNELQSLSISGNTITLTKGGSIALPVDEVNDADSDPNNEIQILTRNQDTLFLSSGGYVVLPEDQVNDADSDPSNELQSLSISGGTISLSSGGSVTIFDGNYSNLTNTPFIPTTTTDLVNTSGFLTSEIDGSTTNELQAISISNDTIFLSNGGFVKLPASQGFDGQYSSLSGAPTLPTKTSDLINDSGFLTTEVDGSTTNEIQTISKSGSTISLSSNGGSVTVFDGDYDNLTNAPLIPTNTSDLNNDSGFLTHEIDSSTTNEIQTISSSNDTLYLSKGGGEIYLASSTTRRVREFGSGNWNSESNLHDTMFIVPTGVSSLRIEIHGVNGGNGAKAGVYTIGNQYTERVGGNGGYASIIKILLINITQGDSISFNRAFQGNNGVNDCIVPYAGTGTSFFCQGDSGEDGETTHLRFNGEIIASLPGGTGGEGGIVSSTGTRNGSAGYPGELSSIPHVIHLGTTFIALNQRSEIFIAY